MVIVDPDTTQPLPAVGLGAGGCEAPLTESEILNLRLMHLSHLRVDVNLVEPAWQSVMSHGIAQAVALGVPAAAQLRKSGCSPRASSLAPHARAY